VLDPADFDLSPYVKTAECDVDAAFETLFDWSGDEFSNPWIKRLMGALHDNESFARQFKQSPAASFHHHNYQGGLAEHVLEVWNTADRMAGLYPDRIDRELLLAGAALHDVGKVKSYRLNAGISERTEAGELLDHIFISGSMVSNLWDSVVKPEVPAEKADEAARCKALLLHAILAHHGKQEWGSPVLPRTPEALMLHHCDVMSANMKSCFTAIDETPGGETWSDNVYIMDARRRLYIPPLGEGEEGLQTDADE
jgi:3'-5' exoribonuclease